MTMNKGLHILPLLVMLLVAGSAGAQQLVQYSQYLQNPYVLNSASAGVEDFVDVNMSFRKQWVGIVNSPTTFYLSVDAPIGKELDLNTRKASVRVSNPNVYRQRRPSGYHGVGGYIMSDNWGPYKTTRLSLSYAYHLPISREFTLAFSPKVGMTQVAFDQSKAVTELAGDVTYQNYVSNFGNTNRLDIDVALWLQGNAFFFGYATDQLLQDRLNFGDAVSNLQVKVHHMAISGYRFYVREDLSLTPNIVVKYLDQSPISFDINLRGDYQERYWGGLSYRSDKSFVIMGGFYLSNTLKLGYSFDYGLSQIRSYNAGSHEIVLGLSLFNKVKTIF